MHDKFVPRRFGWYALKRIPVRRLGSAGIAMMVVAPAVAGSAAMFGTNPVLAAGQTAVRPTLTASDGAAGDGFANSLAISGSIAVVGASGKNSLTGAAYVFTRTGSTWSQQAELTASDGVAGDYFGYSVATSGSTVVVGAYGKNSGAGAAYVFGRSGTTWTQQAKLTAADGGAPDFFGVSVAVSGSTAVVGAYNKNSHVGAAEVFVGSGTTWTHQAELTASDGVSPDFFGFSVAISGSTAVVGAPLPFLPRHRGGAYVFVQSGTTWTQLKILSASDGTLHQGFGSPVAISGSTALVGHFSRTSMIGSVYIFHV
jgi:hypothetical protein